MNVDTPRGTLSRPLLMIAAVLFGAGVVTGAVLYGHRTHEPAVHHAGTAAWPIHLVLTALAGLVLVSLARRGRLGSALWAPLGTSAAARVRLTSREALHRPRATLRTLCAAPFAALFLYGFWRAGVQVVAGLDPQFTVDAWGGPSYLGAMYCHYLDGALMMAAAAVALDRLLLREHGLAPARQVRAATSNRG